MPDTTNQHNLGLHGLRIKSKREYVHLQSGNRVTASYSHHYKIYSSANSEYVWRLATSDFDRDYVLARNYERYVKSLGEGC